MNIKNPKIFFLIFLCFTNFVLAQECFYAIVMHATHDENYDHFTWQKGVELFKSLKKNCHENESDKSFEAFTAKVDEAIKAIKDIFDLYKNKLGIRLNIDILRQSFEYPTHGLYFNLSSALEATPLENYEQIEFLLTNAEKAKDKYPFNILEIIKPILLLSFGEIGLDVNIYE